jgi:hypothetical protein
LAGFSSPPVKVKGIFEETLQKYSITVMGDFYDFCAAAQKVS